MKKPLTFAVAEAATGVVLIVARRSQIGQGNGTKSIATRK